MILYFIDSKNATIQSNPISIDLIRVFQPILNYYVEPVVLGEKARYGHFVLGGWVAFPTSSADQGIRPFIIKAYQKLDVDVNYDREKLLALAKNTSNFVFPMSNGMQCQDFFSKGITPEGVYFEEFFVDDPIYVASLSNAISSVLNNMVFDFKQIQLRFQENTKESKFDAMAKVLLAIRALKTNKDRNALINEGMQRLKIIYQLKYVASKYLQKAKMPLYKKMDRLLNSAVLPSYAIEIEKKPEIFNNKNGFMAKEVRDFVKSAEEVLGVKFALEGVEGEEE